MKNIDILHIYSGTSGVAGLYLESFMSALSVKFSQEAVVSYYYPFKGASRVFYKYTELCSPFKRIQNSRFRYFFRYIELVFAFISIILLVFRKNPKVICYSLISTLKIELFFINILRCFSNSKIAIICHDVVPFESVYTTANKAVMLRRKIFESAHYLIIHNKYSEQQLISIGLNKSKFIFIPFPPMDITKLYSKNTISSSNKSFLFLGHLRKEKGIDILIEAWKTVNAKHQNATLIIAGNIPKNTVIADDLYRYNIKLVPEYLSDDIFYAYLSSSSFLVLPYRRSTNSGFPFLAASVGVMTIATKIPTFIENPIVLESLYFQNEDIAGLADVIQQCITLSDAEITIMRSIVENRLNQYKIEFSAIANDALKQIIL